MTNSLAYNIISLPHVLQNSIEDSIFSLLNRVGYFLRYDEINSSVLYDTLLLHPSYVADWFEWSSSKRTTGWFLKEDNESYLVGNYSNEKGINSVMIYTNRIEACALFIMKEIEDVRNSSNN